MAQGVHGRTSEKVRNRRFAFRALLSKAIKPVAEQLEVRRLLSVTPGGQTTASPSIEPATSILELIGADPDPNFGTGGLVRTDFNGSQDQANAVISLASSGGDADLLVAGHSGASTAVALYGANGALFSKLIGSVPGFSSSTLTCAALDGTDSSGDPLVVVGGGAATGSLHSSYLTMRVKIVGTGANQSIQLDTTWGSNGFATTSISGGFDQGHGIAVSADGKDVYVVGTATNSSFVSHMAVEALLNASGPAGAAGSLDPAFATGGIYVASGTSTGNGVVLNSANPGGPVVAIDGQGSSSQGQLTLLSPAGSLISSTDENLGSTSSNLTSITTSLSGEYLLGGVADSQSVIAEATSAGSLDTTFGTGGETKISVPNSTSSQISAVQTQPNGKIVGIGYQIATNNDTFVVVRLNLNGSLDTSGFGSPNGYVQTGFGGTINQAFGGSIQPDGLIVAAGVANNGPGGSNDFALARYVSNNGPTATNSSISLGSIFPGVPSAGTSVDTIVQRLAASDIDSNPLGIAMDGLDLTNGQWQYSTNSGASWTAVDATASDTHALTLTDSTNNLVRFVPNSGFSGTASITLRVWDQTTGSNGAYSNVLANAAANYNSFSANTSTATVSVQAQATSTNVDTKWAGSQPGQIVTDFAVWPGQTFIFGYNASDTVQGGVNLVSPNGTVNLAPGTYNENDVVTFPVTVLGPNQGVSGTSTSRGAEAVINGGTGTAITVQGALVTVNGLELTGGTAISANGAVGVQDSVIDTNGTGISISGAGSAQANLTVSDCFGTVGGFVLQMYNTGTAGATPPLQLNNFVFQGNDFSTGGKAVDIESTGDTDINNLTIGGTAAGQVNTITSSTSGAGGFQIAGANLSLGTILVTSTSTPGAITFSAAATLSAASITETGNQAASLVASSVGNLTVTGLLAYTNDLITGEIDNAAVSDGISVVSSEGDVSLTGGCTTAFNQVGTTQPVQFNGCVVAAPNGSITQAGTLNVYSNVFNSLGMGIAWMAGKLLSLGGPVNIGLPPSQGQSQGNTINSGNGALCFSGNLGLSNTNSFIAQYNTINANNSEAIDIGSATGDVSLPSGTIGNNNINVSLNTSLSSGIVSVTAGGNLNLGAAITNNTTNITLSGLVPITISGGGFDLAAGTAPGTSGNFTLGAAISSNSTIVTSLNTTVSTLSAAMATFSANGNIALQAGSAVDLNSIVVGTNANLTGGSIGITAGALIQVAAPMTLSGNDIRAGTGSSISLTAPNIQLGAPISIGLNSTCGNISLNASGAIAPLSQGANASLSFTSNVSDHGQISVTAGSISLRSCNATANTVGAINVLANGPAGAGDLTINGLSTYQNNTITGTVGLTPQPVQNGLSYVSLNGNVSLTGGCVTVGNQVGTIAPLTSNGCLVFAPNGNLTQSGGAVNITDNTFNSIGMGVAWMAGGVQSLGGPFSVGAPGAGNTIVSGNGAVCISASTITAGTLNIQNNQATGSDTGIDLEASTGSLSASAVNISGNTVADINVSSGADLFISGPSTYQNNIITGSVGVPPAPVPNGISLVSTGGNVSLTGGCVIIGNQIGIGTGSLPPSANGCLVAAPKGSITQSGNLNICANVIQSSGMGIAWIAGTTMTLGGPVYIGMLDTTTTPPTNEGNTITSATGALCFTAGTGLTATNALNVEYNNITANPNPSPTGDSDGVDISATNGSVSLGSGSSFINNTITGDATVGIAVTATGGDVTLGSGSSFSDNTMHWTLEIRVQRVDMSIAARPANNTGGNVNIGAGTAFSGNIFDGGTIQGVVQPASGGGIDISASATGGGSGAGKVSFQDLHFTSNQIATTGDGIAIDAGGDLTSTGTGLSFNGDTIGGGGAGTTDDGIAITVGGTENSPVSVLNEKITIDHEGLYFSGAGNWSGNLTLNNNTIGGTGASDGVLIDMSKMNVNDFFTGVAEVVGSTIATDFQPGGGTAGIAFVGGGGVSNGTIDLSNNTVGGAGASDGILIDMSQSADVFSDVTTVDGNTIGTTFQPGTTSGGVSFLGGAGGVANSLDLSGDTITATGNGNGVLIQAATTGPWSGNLTLNANTIGGSGSGDAVVVDMSNNADAFSGITTINGSTLGTTFQPGTTGGFSFIGGSGGATNTFDLSNDNIAPGGDGTGVELNGGSGGFTGAITINANTIGGTAAGDGIYYFFNHGGGQHTLVISGNTINGTADPNGTSAGIYIDQHPANSGQTNVIITGNTIGGGGVMTVPGLSTVIPTPGFANGIVLNGGTTQNPGGGINATIGDPNNSTLGNTIHASNTAIVASGPSGGNGINLATIANNLVYIEQIGLDAKQGESAQTNNNKWIEINSFQWGIGRGISSSSGATVVSRRGSIDMTHAEFAQAIYDGVFVDDAGFQGTNDIITGVGTSQSVGLDVGSDEQPTERVSLNFSKIIMKYAVEDDAPGLVVDTSGNDWGTNTEEGIHNLITGTSAGQVDYTPWLDKDTNFSTTGGFQGDLSQLDVGSGGAETVPQGLTEQGRITEALNLLQPPPAGTNETPTINVFGADPTIGTTGIFKEDVTINQKVYIKVVLGFAEILGDGSAAAITVGSGGGGSSIVGFPALDGASKDAAKMTITAPGDTTGPTGVSFIGDTFLSTNAYAVEIDNAGAGDILTGNTFESTGLGNVSVADGSNTIGGTAAGDQNTFTAPPIGNELPGTPFLQFIDSSGVADGPNSNTDAEVASLLGNNTFNRSVSDLVLIGPLTKSRKDMLWADINPAITQAGPGDTVTAGAGNYDENLLITQDLTLDGPQAGNTGTSHDRESSAPSVSEAVITAPANSNVPAVQITGGTVVVDGVKIDTSSSSLIPAVQVTGGTAQLQNDVILAGGTGVEIDPGAAAGWYVKSSYMWYAIAGAGTTGYGLSVDGGVGGEMAGDDVAGTAGANGAGIWVKHGILPSKTVKIDGGNIVRDNPTGILADGGFADVEGNNIYANGTGLEATANTGGGIIATDDWETPAALVAPGSTPQNNATDVKFDAGAIKWQIGDGNTFEASNFYIVNDSSQTLDLSGDTSNSFGGYKPQVPASPSDSTTLANNYALEDKIYDQLDDPAAGYVKIFVKDVFLAASAEKTHKDSLQRAVEVCDDGNNIYVQAGQFFDDGVNGIIIDKAVTLLGANAGSSGTDRESSAPSLSEIVVTKPIDIASAGLVTLDGFDISTTSGDLLPAVQLTGGGSAVQNNVIQAGGTAVEIDQGAVAGWFIKYNYMKYGLAGQAGDGIVLGPGAPSGNIYGNDLNGDGIPDVVGILGNAGPNATVNVGDGTAGGANTFRGNAVGVEDTNNSIFVKFDVFTNNGIGVQVTGGSAFLDGNTFNQNATGISASGGALLAQNNNLSGNAEGVQVSGGAVVDLGEVSPNANFTPLGTSAGNNILTGYSGAPNNYAIDDENSSSQPNVYAQNNNFGPASSSNQQAIQAVIHDSGTNPAFSTVIFAPAQNTQAAPTNVYVNAAWAGLPLGSDPDGSGPATSIGYDAFSSIQAGVNGVASGGTVHIEHNGISTVYDESNILVSQPETIIGDSESGVIVAPTFADSHTDSSFGGTVSNGFVIASSKVTIEDLTIDGNANSTMAGAQNFRNGVITNSQNDNHTYNSLVLDHLTVQNIYRKGVALYNLSGVSTGNSIANSTFTDIATDGALSYEGAFTIAVFQSNATISGNVITHSGAGIAVNSFDGPQDGPLVSITGNTISSPVLNSPTNGALGMDLGSMADGSAVSGNNIDMTGGNSNDVGLIVSFVAGQVTVSGNTIGGSAGDDAILLYQDNLPAKPVVVTNNTLTGAAGAPNSGVGILLTALPSDAARFSDVPGPVYATVSGNTINGFATGVSLASDGAAGDIVSATVGGTGPTDGNSITASGPAIIVVATGSLTIEGNSLTTTGSGDALVLDGTPSFDPNVAITGNTIGGSVTFNPDSNGNLNLGNVDLVSDSISGPTNIGGQSSGAGAGKVKFNEFTIKKTSDQASVNLFGSNVSGGSVDLGIVTVDGNTIGGAGAPDALHISAFDVQMTQLTITGNTFGGQLSIISTGTPADTTGGDVTIGTPGAINETLTISNNRSETVGADESITIHGGRDETVNGSTTITANTDQKITVSADRTETVSQNESITISGNMTETVDQNESITIQGNQSVALGGLSVSNNNLATGISVDGGDVTLGAGSIFTQNTVGGAAAGDGISLQATGGGGGTGKVSFQDLHFTSNTIKVNGSGIIVVAVGDLNGDGVNDLTIQGNSISSGGDGVSISAGGALSQSPIVIQNNTIGGTAGGDGVLLSKTASDDWEAPVSILGNTIGGAGAGDGVFVQDAGGGSWSGALVIGSGAQGNLITGNSIGISLDGGTSAGLGFTGPITVSGNTIGGSIGGVEILVDFEEGDPDRPLITGNVLNGPGNLDKTSTGIKIEQTGGASSFTIDSNQLGGFGTGIELVTSNGGTINATIGSSGAGNTFTNSFVAVDMNGDSLPDLTVAASFNSFSGNGTAMQVLGGTLNSNNNTIEINSFQWGIGRGISSPTGGSADRVIHSRQDSADMTVQEFAEAFFIDAGSFDGANDIITGVGTSQSVGLDVGSDEQPTERVSLNFSKIIMKYAVEDDAPGLVVDTSGNDWGTNTEEGIHNLITGTSAGQVDYTPWLDKDTNFSTTGGFQGDLSQLDVGSGGAETVPQGLTEQGRITEALNLLQPPPAGTNETPTINVFGADPTIGTTGIFKEDVTINQKVYIKVVLGFAEILGDGSAAAITVGSGGGGSSIVGFPALDGASKDAAKMTITAPGDTTGPTGVSFIGDTFLSTNAYAVEIDNAGAGDILTGNTFESTGLGNVSVADGSNTIGGTAAGDQNTFTAPPIGNELPGTPFLQFIDSSGVADGPNSNTDAEVASLLGNNTFNRSVSDLVLIGPLTKSRKDMLWADINPAITQAGPGDTVTAGAGNYDENLLITQDLTLDGPQAGNTGTSHDRESSAPSVSEAVITAPANSNVPAVQITGGTVVVDGVKIDTSSSSLIPAVQVTGGTAQLQNDVILAGGTGVEIDPGAAAGWYVKSSYMWYAIAGAGTTGYGLSVDGGVGGEMAGDDVAGTAGANGAGIWVKHGILPSKTVKIDGGNIVRDNPTGILADGGFADVEGNNIYANGTGLEATANTGGGIIATDDWETPAALVAPGSTPQNNATDVKFDAGAIKWQIGDGNTFEASNFYIVNDSSQTLDLSGDTSNSFGGYKPQVPSGQAPFNQADAATIANNYALEDKTYDYLDDPNSGYVKYFTNDVFVTQLSENTNADAIQRGVNVSPSGGNLYVQAGTFDGSFVINQSLTLLGARAGVAPTDSDIQAAIANFRPGDDQTVVLKSPGRTSYEPITLERGVIQMDGFWSWADGVQSGESGIVVQGTAQADILNTVVEDAATGVQVTPGATATINNSYIFEDPNNASLPGSIGIEVTWSSAGPNTPPTVADMNGDGILDLAIGVQVSGSGASASVIDDKHISDGAAKGQAQEGILTDAGGSVTVQGGSYSGFATGIAIGDVNGDGHADIANASIAGNTTGIAVSNGSTATITDSTFYVPPANPASGGGSGTSGNGVGVLLNSPGAVEVADNDISNQTTAGVVIQGGISGNLSVHNNFLENDATGVLIQQGVTLSSGASIKVNDNAIDGNSTAGLENDSVTSVDATLNWWGSASGPSGVGPGTGDKIIGPTTVSFSPWLTDGTDTDNNRADGFQPSTVQGLSVSGGQTVNAVEAEPLGPVLLATFTDPGNTSANTAGYSGDINWGDGTGNQLNSALITYDPAAQVFDVWGSHIYAEEDGTPFTITVQLHKANFPDSPPVFSTANVAEEPISIQGGQTVNADEATPTGNVLVATFRDPGNPTGDLTEAGEYSVDINWGDGTGNMPNSGLITYDPATGLFKIWGAHTYAEEENSPYPISITLHHAGAQQTVISSAQVADLALTDVNAVQNVQPVEGQGAQPMLLATFKDPGNPTGDITEAGEYAVDINWGDGTGFQFDSGIVAYNFTTGLFQVFGSHAYSQESAADHPGSGPYTITLRVHHEATPVISVTDTATVSDPAVVPTGGFTFNTGEGSSTGNQTVATFTDPGGAEALTDYGAMIDWGDGSPASPGTITFAAGTFTVTGNHTYAEESGPEHTGGLDHYVVKVTIDHENAPSAMAIDSAFVSDPSVSATGGFAVTASEGSDSGVQTVASFIDPGGPEALADYSASINWGDGSAAGAGTIVLGPVVAGVQTFLVQGHHTYAEESAADHPGSTPYGITVTIEHESSANVVVNSIATVSDPAVQGSGTQTTAVEGAPATLTVATFTDPGGAEALGDYSATIGWGDGTTTLGTIQPDTVVAGQFDVVGSHTYAEESAADHPLSAPYTVNVTIGHENAPNTIVHSAVTVSDPAVIATGGFSVTATEGSNSGVQTVATFSDPGGAEALTDYNASILWGDGTPATAGTILLGPVVAGAQTYLVQGIHTYAEEGAYGVTVVVQHESAPNATVNSIAIVSDPAVQATGGFTVNAIEGNDSGLQTVATFTDPGGAEVSGDYVASIDWGDGSPIGGATIVAGPIVAGVQTFLVQGHHTYSEESAAEHPGSTPYPLTVTIRHDSAPSAVVNSAAIVSDPPVQASGTQMTAVEGANSLLTVATFTDPGGTEVVGDYSANIHWGDGTPDTPGIITLGSGGIFLVQGNHTYTEESAADHPGSAPYNVTVTIQHENSAPNAIATSTVLVIDPPVSATGGFTVSATEGLDSGLQTVATFTDPAGAENVSDYTASIDWGDGSPASVGTITLGSGGVFSVQGHHAFAEEGNAVITVTIQHESSTPNAVVNSTATVADAPLTAGSFTPPAALEGIPLVNVPVFHFTDADPNGNVADYTALVTLGDGNSLVVNGTPSTKGQIVASQGGGFDVQISYTWAEEMSGKTFNVVVIDLDGGVNGSGPRSTTSDGVNNFSVGDAPLTAGTLSAGGGVAGSAPATLAAHFSDGNTGAPTSDFSGTINWGDGSITPFASTSVSGTGGSYTVNGSHTYSSQGTFNISVTVNDVGGKSTTINGSATVVPVTVAAEYVFYNNSKFDGNDPAANPATDFNAVATDKTPLLPGGTGTFANYTSYSRGLNGLLIDFAGLSPTTVLTASDFVFKVGNNNTPSSWTTAPAPTQVDMGTDPANGDRAVDVVWADNAIQNEWLQATVLGGSTDPNTHLAANFAFYYGNVIGDTGNSTTNTLVDSGDVILTLNHETGTGAPAAVTNPYDLNRDGKVDAGDVILALNNETGTKTPVQLITVPVGPGVVSAAMPAIAAAAPAIGSAAPPAAKSASSASSALAAIVAAPALAAPVAPVVVATGLIMPTASTGPTGVATPATPKPTVTASPTTLPSKRHHKPAAKPQVVRKAAADQSTPLFSKTKITMPKLT